MKLLMIMMGFVFALNSFAGLLIEPQIGYILSGNNNYKMGNPSIGLGNVESTYSGADYGARLGVKFLGVMGGLSYFKNSYKLKASWKSTNITMTPGSDNSDWSQDSFGVFVGYNAPLWLRAWVAYHFSVTAKVSTPSADWYSKGDKMSGSSTELGLGFTGLPFVSLNVIYRMISFTKFTNSMSPLVVQDSSPKELLMSISLPFDI